MISSCDAGVRVLPPFQWSMLCVKYPQSVGAAGETPPLPWSQALSRQLAAVNANVNGGIISKPDSRGLGDTWNVWPSHGNCNDFAVSKRHELLKAGIPASCLLLAEVRTSGGEGHVILIVRTTNGEIVMDNLTPALMSMSDVNYSPIKMQSPTDPNVWTSWVHP